jgi:hypothetical protein
MIKSYDNRFVYKYAPAGAGEGIFPKGKLDFLMQYMPEPLRTAIYRQINGCGNY